MRWTPHNYQIFGVQHLIENPGAGLILDPGMGKTSITLAALSILFAAKKISKVLIVAPLRVCKLVWPLEVKKWDDFNHLSICNLVETDESQKALYLKENHQIYLINPESLKALLSPKLWAGQGFDCLVIDESTKFKDTSTQRFKALKPLLGQFKRRYILTGTPSPNGYEDLFGQMYIVDLGAALGKYITHFRNLYFRANPYNQYDIELMPGADARIQELIRPKLLSFKDTDFLDLPELVHNEIYVQLPPKARKHYKEMEREFFTLLDSGEAIFGPNAAVAGGKCRQIANGSMYFQPDLTKPREVVHMHDEKLKAFLDLTEQLQGQPMLTAYEFQFDAEAIEKALPRAVNITSTKEVELVNDMFNKGHIPTLIGHPASMGHGLNLQGACHHICMFGITWNYELYGQFIKRVYRQGNNAERVHLHWIIAEDTLDVKVQRVLKMKEASDEAVKAALKGEIQ